MVYYVNSQNRHQFDDLIRQMHEHRRKVFVEGLGWDLEVTGDGLEIDQFDTDDASYLLCEEDGVLMASARLLDTSKPHLMSEIFEHLCDNDVPSDERTFEISRLCPNPSLRKGTQYRPVVLEIMCAVMELGLLMGWDRLTMAVGLEALPFCLRCGWDVTPLGLPHYSSNRDLIAAFVVNISPAGLQAVRGMGRVDRSVLVMPDQAVPTAA